MQKKKHLDYALYYCGIIFSFVPIHLIRWVGMLYGRLRYQRKSYHKLAASLDSPIIYKNNPGNIDRLIRDSLGMAVFEKSFCIYPYSCNKLGSLVEVNQEGLILKEKIEKKTLKQVAAFSVHQDLGASLTPKFFKSFLQPLQVVSLRQNFPFVSRLDQKKIQRIESATSGSLLVTSDSSGIRKYVEHIKNGVSIIQLIDFSLTKNGNIPVTFFNQEIYVSKMAAQLVLNYKIPTYLVTYKRIVTGFAMNFREVIFPNDNINDCTQIMFTILEEMLSDSLETYIPSIVQLKTDKSKKE